MEISGKKIIISGGANGIGKALSLGLSSLGAVVGVLDINSDGLEEIGRSIPDITCIKCDVTSVDEIRTSVDVFCAKHKQVDFLINNAGIVYNSPLVSIGKDGLKIHDVQMWEKVISTNLNSVFYLTSCVIEGMVRKRTKGLIINIASICASGNSGQGAYSAAKAGINALTVTWAKELASFGIRVAAVAPGFVRTETTIKSMSEHLLSDWTAQTPLRRLGTVDEIFQGVLFIIGNDFYTGRVLEIDGGLRV